MTPKQGTGIPKVVDDLIKVFDRMPGIGPKTAARLAFYWLRVPAEEVKRFTEVLSKVKVDVRRCSECFNLSTEKMCPICSDDQRNKLQICIVEDALDLLSIERVGKYSGLYHVLEGVISPVDNIGPEDLTIDSLVQRLKRAVSSAGKDVEIIIATNPTMEGEATAMYIRDLVKGMKRVKVSRLAQGLPSGADIEYADQLTIARAFEQRSKYE